MRRRNKVAILAGACAVLLLAGYDPDARADPVPVPLPVPAPGPGQLPAGGVIGGGGLLGDAAAGAAGAGIGISAPQLAPAVASIFLCAGRGAAVSVGPFGGGYCDYDFVQIPLPGGIVGTMHIHCEWGSASFIMQIFNCWRVFPGFPDHPALNDPDIIPDGFYVPWQIAGPTPSDVWPPPGLAPIPPPPPPAPDLEPTGPPPGPPP